MTAKITRFNPDQLHETPGYHHITVVEAYRTAYLAGQCPLDQCGSLVGPGALETQVDQVVANALAALAAVNAQPQHVVRSVIYVRSDDREDLGIAWSRLYRFRPRTGVHVRQHALGGCAVGLRRAAGRGGPHGRAARLSGPHASHGLRRGSRKRDASANASHAAASDSSLTHELYACLTARGFELSDAVLCVPGAVHPAVELTLLRGCHAQRSTLCCTPPAGRWAKRPGPRGIRSWTNRQHGHGAAASDRR